MEILCIFCRKFFIQNGSLSKKAISVAKCKACIQKWNKIRKLSTVERAEMALKEAVRGVIEERIRTGRPLIVWRNGKVVKIPASQLSRKRASQVV